MFFIPPPLALCDKMSEVLPILKCLLYHRIIDPSFFLMRASSFSSFSAPWPDPNSPVLSKIDFGVPLPELFKWLNVRDTLLGRNERKQDMKNALTLARDCKHPDAMWLTSIFEGKNVSTKEEGRKVFLSLETDARALCFAWCLNDDLEDDLTFLRRASEMRSAFACSTLCEQFLRDEKDDALRFAELAATQHERDGFFVLGVCFRNRVGCEVDLDVARENFLIGAELGHIRAANIFGDLLDEFDPGRCMWLSRSALHGLSISFLDFFSNQVERFCSGSGNSTVMFFIGRALKGNIDIENEQIFGHWFDFVFRIEPANLAISFFESQIKSARLAIDTWTLVSTRLHLIKDMRILIGKMIWEARFEANYKN